MKNSNVIITPDFSQTADYPLSKTKFGVFNSCIVPVRRYKRDIEAFREVQPESLRIDLGWSTPWAGWIQEIFDGTPEEPVYDFSEVDELTELLNSVNCLPYWSYCYMFKPLQGPGGDWQSVPCDYQAWGRMLADVVRHSRQGGQATKIGYHEIYNEPDNGVFTRANLDEYLRMYQYGSKAIRDVAGDPLIGGPALAFSESWIEPFLSFVSKNHLPLDFFSFHYYGTREQDPVNAQVYNGKSFKEAICAVRNYLSAHPEFATTELHLNELNSFPIDYPQYGLQDQFGLAAYLLHDYKYLLEQPDVSLVHWAQFLDSGNNNFSGMVNIEGFRKAVFNGYKLYTRMPVDRAPVQIQGASELEAIASVDEHCASTLIWNLSGSDQTFTIHFSHIPFVHGTLRVYRIDENHCSYTENHRQEQLTPCEIYENIETDQLTWAGILGHECVICFEVDDGCKTAALPPHPVANVIRVLRYYPNRGAKAYADFDKNTWIFRLGMAGETLAHCEIGVTAEGISDKIDVTVLASGVLERLTENSILGIRIDYQVGQDYTKGVLYHGLYGDGPDLYDPSRSAIIPYGSKQPADQIVAVEDFSSFKIELKKHAPLGWSGRAQIMVIMQDAGPTARVKIGLSPSIDKN